MKIRAIRNSHGFKGTYWEAGKITDLQDGAEIPPHFEAIDKVEVSTPVVAQAPTALKRESVRKNNK